MIKIKGDVPSKKNSRNIFVRGGKPVNIPNKNYKEWSEEALWQLKEQKATIQIGVSTFIKNICIVVTKHTVCGACSEHCPTKAVEMVPYLGSLTIPKVDEKICIGCGACEYACPTKPDKAFYVEANSYHRKALKPKKKIEDKKKTIKPTDDFPF